MTTLIAIILVSVAFVVVAFGALIATIFVSVASALAESDD